MKEINRNYNKKGAMCKCNSCNIFDYCLPILIDKHDYYLCEYCRKIKYQYEKKDADFKSLLIKK